MAGLPVAPEEVAAYRARIRWSVGAQHALIARARHHRILWDHSHPSYAKKNPKRAAWKVVASGLRHDFPELDALDLNEDDVQAKFSKLKSSYQRELRKIQSGSGSKWEYFRSFTSMYGVDDPYSCLPPITLPMPSHDQACQYLIPEVGMKVGEEGEEHAGLTPSPLASSPCPSPSSNAPTQPRRRGGKSATEALLERTVWRINAALGQSERAAADVAARTGDLVTNFLFLLAAEKKRRLALKIIRLLQSEVLEPDDVA